MATVREDVDRIIAGLPGVHDAIMAEATEIGARAEALLAEHFETGASEIKVRKAGRKDAVVELVDEAAISIELGHFSGPHTHVEGLHILGRAARL